MERGRRRTVDSLEWGDDEGSEDTAAEYKVTRANLNLNFQPWAQWEEETKPNSCTSLEELKLYLTNSILKRGELYTFLGIPSCEIRLFL